MCTTTLDKFIKKYAFTEMLCCQDQKNGTRIKDIAIIKVLRKDRRRGPKAYGLILPSALGLKSLKVIGNLAIEFIRRKNSPLQSSKSTQKICVLFLALPWALSMTLS